MKIIDIALPNEKCKVLEYREKNSDSQFIKCTSVILTMKHWLGYRLYKKINPTGVIDHYSERMTYADELGKKCGDEIDDQVNNFLYNLQINGKL